MAHVPILHALAVVLALMTPFLAHASPDKTGVITGTPSPSPTGRELVFTADFDGPTRLWIAGVDGSRLRKLTAPTSPHTTDLHPSWSPDGQWIAYTSMVGTASEIWMIRSDGTQATRIVADNAANSEPSWSPDGRTLLFVSDKDGTTDIWAIDLGNSRRYKVYGSSEHESIPRFSPAGDQIVFVRTTGTGANLWIVKADGTSPRQLTRGDIFDIDASWGSKGIVFASNSWASGGSFKLWLVQPDGSNLRRIGDVDGHMPVWLPDGRIAYSDATLVDKALSAIAVVDPATAQRRLLVDVQGLLTPIDIRPGKLPNPINPKSAGRVPVAILSTRSFDARSVDTRTLTFGRTGAEPSLASCNWKLTDVNGDGLADLLCRFFARSTGLQEGNTTGVLRFSDKQGIAFEGRDAIVITSHEEPADLRD